MTVRPLCERCGTRVKKYNSWFWRCPNCCLAKSTGKEIGVIKEVGHFV